MSNIKSIKAGHGLSGSGLGHPLALGVTGPGGKFTGRTMTQDIERKTSMSQISNEGPRNPKIGGAKTGRTGGQGRKFAGNVGPGGYNK